jgi:hypothetical protein
MRVVANNNRCGVSGIGARFVIFCTWLTIIDLSHLQIDEVRHRLSDTASQIKEKAREYGSEAKGFVQSKTDTSLAA